MILKEKILNILNENKGKAISGEFLAQALHVSRTTISKNIKLLKNDGFEIEAVTNSGYRLSEQTNIIDKDKIVYFLNNSNYFNNLNKCGNSSKKSPYQYSIDKNIYIFNSIHSTNLKAKEFAISGATHGTTIIANHQTDGRGRHGKSFFSPANTGIYMSIILKPNWDISKSTLITIAGAIAVKRSIKKLLHIDLDIKWVNDLFYQGKKVCGILTEAISDFETNSIDTIILGIGLNVDHPFSDFPKELKEIATSLNGKQISTKNTLQSISREEIMAEIIIELLKISQSLNANDFITEYKNSSLALGKTVRIVGTNEPVQVLDINDLGHLIVLNDKGETKELSSGEISILL